jgi:type III secretion system FlhB-like substrate exporter
MRRRKMKERKTAAAISYKSGDPAPRLTAAGRDREAERIIALAREAGIEIVEDPPLAALLDAGVKTGDIIPVWCWEAVAKILAFVLTKEKNA